MRARLFTFLLALPFAACAIPEDGDRPVVYQSGPAVAGPGGWTYRTSPSYGYDQGRSYDRRWGGSGWGSSPPSRVFRPERRVVCDRATQVCYNRGRIDKSDTEDHFGDRAGDRADRYRDRYGSDAVITGRNSYCDRSDKVCYKNGNPDRSDTRDMFGKKAARRVD